VYCPYNVFIAANSDILYIADTFNNRILKWLPGTTGGILIAGQDLGSNATQLSSPFGLCTDTNENVYVSGMTNARVQYFKNGSSVGRTIAGNGTSGSANNLLGYSIGVGVDLANNLYISDSSNARVMKWSPNATSGIRVAGTGVAGNATNQLNNPIFLYVEPTTGTLYIPNKNSHCITKWLPGSTNGTVVAGTCGISGSNTTLLNNPTCVTFDKYGNMYVVDYVNHGRVMIFPPNSSIGIPIITSGFSLAYSVAVDTHLNLYVADANNCVILKYMSL
jgi:hypothetical protein